MRRAERLIAEVLDALSQRDALVAELEQQAGRGLVELKTLRWPSISDTAQACGVSGREAARLRALAAGARTAVDQVDAGVDLRMDASSSLRVCDDHLQTSPLMVQAIGNLGHLDSSRPPT